MTEKLFTGTLNHNQNKQKKLTQTLQAGSVGRKIFFILIIPEKDNFIMVTNPCNVDPTYIPILCSKTGVYRGIHCFLILLINIDCGFSSTIYVLSKNKKNITIYHLKIIIFTAVKHCRMHVLHRRVIVMYSQPYFNLEMFCRHSGGLRVDAN